MEEQQNETGKETVAPSSDNNYLDAINDLTKQKALDKAEIEKLKADNKRLVNEFINGQTGNVVQEVIPTNEQIAQMRKELFTPVKELSNLEYAIKTLELRDAVIKAGGIDPFLPVSRDRNATPENVETAERVANVLETCIKAAEGSSEVFTAELMRRTK